jgi:membrane protein YqaA with SNARE-associated domain
MKAAGRPAARWVLALVSFSESAFLPLPVDAVSIPLMLADRRSIWWVVVIATATSVAGGLLGYVIGRFLVDTVGGWLIDAYGLQAQFRAFQTYFAQVGWLIVIVGGLTPLPYKVISIASGLGKFDLPTFLFLSLMSRGARFAGLGLLFWWFGPPIKGFIDRNLALAGWIVLILLAGGFAALWLL